MSDFAHSTLIRKLVQSGFLQAADCATLEAITPRTRVVGARQDLIAEGD